MTQPGPAYQLSSFILHAQDRTLLRDGEPVPLAPRLFDVLLVLVEARGRLVTKDDLLQRVWSGVYIDESNIKQNISLLRKTLEPGYPDESPILTVRKQGYRFTGEVRLIPGLGAPAAAPGESGAASSAWQETHSAAAKEQRGFLLQNWLVLAIGAFALLLIAAGASVYRMYWGAGHARRSVAILAFQNLSGNPEAAWFSTALRETLFSDLAAGETLKIIPDESVARMQSELNLQPTVNLSEDALKRISANLHCDLVIGGNYLQVGDQLRLNLYLQDAHTGKILGRFTQTSPAADLLQLISSAGGQLRNQLGIAPLSVEQDQMVAASVPSTTEDFRLYSEGLEQLRVLNGPGALLLLQQSLAINPNYPLVHSALSQTWTLMGEDKKAAAEAKSAYDFSAKLSREERLQVQSRYEEVTQQWDKAVETQTELWKAFPDNVDYGVKLAQILLLAGRPKDALVTITHLQASPVRSDPRIDIAEASIRYQLGDYQKLQAAAQHAEKLAQAQEAHILYGRARTFEGDALTHLGTIAAAHAAFNEARTIAQTYGDKVGLMHALRRDGGAMRAQNPEAAIQLFQQDCAIAAQVGDARETANCQIALGLTYRDIGDLTHEREMFDSSLATAEKISDKRLILVALEGAGRVQIAMAQWQMAQETESRALHLAQEMGATGVLPTILGDQGEMLALQGDLVQGRARLEEAVQLARKTKDTVGLAMQLHRLAAVQLVQGNLAESSLSLQEECHILGEAGQEYRLMVCKAASAEPALAQGKLDEAQTLAQSASAAMNNPVPGFRAARILASIALERKDFVAARHNADLMAGFARANPDCAAQVLESKTLHGQIEAASGHASLAEGELVEVIQQSRQAGLPLQELTARLLLLGFHRPATVTASNWPERQKFAEEAVQRGYGKLASQALRF